MEIRAASPDRKGGGHRGSTPIGSALEQLAQTRGGAAAAAGGAGGAAGTGGRGLPSIPGADLYC